MEESIQPLHEIQINRGLFSGHTKSTLEHWTAALRQFVAVPRFDDAILCSNDRNYPRLSIVMPSFNQVRFIERSILSVLNQNYPNLQFIIMDGGSTDGTLDVIRKYEKYLTWRSEPDRGQSDAINKALLLADGELVGWQNSDDVYFPDVFCSLHNISLKQPRAVLYSGTVALIDPTDRVESILKFIRPSTRRLLYEGYVMSSQGVFWRREIQSSAGVYDVDLNNAMDADFWLRVMARGEAVSMPGLIGAFRIYEGTKTSVAEGRGIVEMHKIRKKYGVDDQTVGWEVMRTALRVSRLFKWMFTRTTCGFRDNSL